MALVAVELYRAQASMVVDTSPHLLQLAHHFGIGIQSAGRRAASCQEIAQKWLF